MGTREPYSLLLFSIITMFILGIIDDLINIQPSLKLFIQFLLALILVWKAEIYIYSFNGLFDIYNLPIWISYIFSILVIVFIINAYNIIDGIDGLSSAVGILALIIYFGIFIFNNNYFDSLLCLSVMGSLFGFWLQNKPPATIFLGDSGTLSIGLFLAYFSIKVSMLPLDIYGNINPVFAMVVLAYPVIDTLRVFTIRIYRGYSPFRADRNHIHHKLLDLGFSHSKCTSIIISINICLIIISYILSDNSTLSYFIMVPIIILLAQIPFSIFSANKINPL
tara:strand:- start:454 stop:1290 length:837 start_codon:yes stop_codon:yes gene_type:complete